MAKIVTNAQQQNSFDMPGAKIDSSLSVKKINFFKTEATYVGDIAGNLMGGKKTGALYLGMANIKIVIETKNIGLWNGGEFFVNGASTHGSMPSEKLFGDFQVASNIEAGNRTYLHELWYRQSFNQSEITIGLQDLNADFLTSETACEFLNSSFGIPSIISDNIPVPIFPLTALGISSKYKLNESFALRGAIYDGLPDEFNQNEYNTNWKLNSDNGYLLFFESDLTTQFENLPGNYKVGGYFHSKLKEYNDETVSEETMFSKNYGFYFLANQTVWQNNETRRLGLFAQLAVSPSNINMHNYYLGAGLCYHGIFDNESRDAFGLAVAHAGFKSKLKKNETTIEMFYKTVVTENLFLQPDVQYIINPAGSVNKLNNALAAFVRFGINF
jgi:porin